MKETGLTRRDFFNKAGKTALGGTVALSFGPILSSCVSVPSTTELKRDPVHYPKLLGHKIQSPEHYGLKGCMVGYHNAEIRRYSPYSNEQIIKEYEAKTGKRPSIMYTSYRDSRLHKYGNYFPSQGAKLFSERGIIPFIGYDLRSPHSHYKRESTKLKEIISGKVDSLIVKFAQKAIAYGEAQGGFFFRTMREMNLSSFPWGKQPTKFKKAWRHIWQIFHEEGANEYATWVWNPFCVFWGPDHNNDSNIESYYPGDEYVDWIGLNAYSHSPGAYGGGFYAGFNKMFSHNIRWMHRKHPKKPIMVAEIGYEQTSGKPKFQRETFEQIKARYPEIKAVLWWDEDWRDYKGGVDSRIDSTPKALQAFKEGITDPYFLDAVPYGKMLKFISYIN